MTLSGKTALVTGSTSGIGLGIAQVLARAGANILLNGFGDPAAALAEVAQHGGKAAHHPADLADVAQIEALFAFAEREFGGVDILVNNAGIQHVAPVEQFPVQSWDKIIALNLSAVFHGTRLALPGMRERDWGRIINIASVHGLVGSTGKAAYVAAKHGVVGLTQTAAWEHAADGIRINSVGPGFINTPLLEKMDAKVRATLEGRHALKRLGTPQEVAALVAWLASDDASFATGAYYAIDGGYLAQ